MAKRVTVNFWITYLANVWWLFNLFFFKQATFLVLTIPAVLHVRICVEFLLW